MDQAIDRAMEATASPGPEFSSKSWAAQRADALVAIAKDYLRGGREGASRTPDHYQVTVHVDELALRGNAGRSELPVETIRRIACDSDLVAQLEVNKTGASLGMVDRQSRYPT